MLLFNCHISGIAASPIVFANSDGGLPDNWARKLCELSSPLPESMSASARSEGYPIGEGARGFAFNADLVDLIRFLDIGTRPSNLR